MTEPQEPRDTGLDPDNNRPAYLLGRLFAHLCDLDQVAADADLDPIDGVYFRKYAVCVAEPTIALRVVDDELPALLRRAAGRDPARAAHLAAAIADLAARIGTPGRLLGPDHTAHQSLFTVGYHHQRSLPLLATVAQLADRYGYKSPAVARVEVNRLGVLSRGRDPDTGAKLYAPAEVDRARAGKVGQGRRTDLTT